jgi:hypothetical protein
MGIIGVLNHQSAWNGTYTAFDEAGMLIEDERLDPRIPKQGL